MGTFFQLRLPPLRSLCQADIKVANPSSMFKPRGFHPSISWTRHGAHPSTQEVEAKRAGIKVILRSIVRPSFLRHGNLFRWLSDCKRTWMLGPRTQVTIGYQVGPAWAVVDSDFKGGGGGQDWLSLPCSSFSLQLTYVTCKHVSGFQTETVGFHCFLHPSNNVSKWLKVKT